MRLTFLQTLLGPVRAAALAQRRVAVAALEHWRRRGQKDARPDTIDLPTPAAPGGGVRVPVLALRPLMPLTLTELRAEWRWHPDTALPPALDHRADGEPMTLSGRLHRARRTHRDAPDGGFDVSVCVRRTTPTEGMLRLQEALARVAGEDRR